MICWEELVGRCLLKTANIYEQQCWSQNKLCLGIDEAGRGPLAGPLVVAGVVFPIDYDSKEIYDSKKLSEKKREELYCRIVEDALHYEIKVITPSEIDKLNIYQATKKAMTDIALGYNVDLVLTDAMPLDIDVETIPLVKGDQKSCSIAAGSILAKVTRDRLMYEYDKQYPEYGFGKHKGYPTSLHLEALAKYGPTIIHRYSYAPVKNASQTKLDLVDE